MSEAFDADGYLLDSPVRPQLGLALWFAADVLAERAHQDVRSVEGGLPPIAKPFCHPSWLGRLARCYAMVRDRLALAAFPIARCTGEEFALHMTISAAAELNAQGLGAEPAAYGMQLMPALGAEDFAEAHNDLFADDDLLLLFEPVLDGIEDPTSPDNQRFGIGPYLHPTRWFDPFPGYDRGQPLARLQLVEAVEDEVIIAATALALTAGARGSVQVLQDGPRWLARARYPGRELVGQGDDARSAATALARLILEGTHCPVCGRTVTIDPGGPPSACQWVRVGQQWQPACTEEDR